MGVVMFERGSDTAVVSDNKMSTPCTLSACLLPCLRACSRNVPVPVGARSLGSHLRPRLSPQAQPARLPRWTGPTLALGVSRICERVQTSARVGLKFGHQDLGKASRQRK